MVSLALSFGCPVDKRDVLSGRRMKDPIVVAGPIRRLPRLLMGFVGGVMVIET